MKKTLPTATIVNELSGSSAFFRKPKKQKNAPPPPVSKTKKTVQPKEITQKKEPALVAPAQKTPVEVHSKKESYPDRTEASKNTGSQAGELASYQASTIERIRKIVKNGGREVTFTRLSHEEKQQMKDLIYTYGRMGIKTTENDIVRIALNYILEDYRASGKASILERVLEALNA